jgi:hypothetical protein
MRRKNKYEQTLPCRKSSVSCFIQIIFKVENIQIKSVKFCDTQITNGTSIEEFLLHFEDRTKVGASTTAKKVSMTPLKESYEHNVACGI